MGWLDVASSPGSKTPIVSFAVALAGVAIAMVVLNKIKTNMQSNVKEADCGCGCPGTKEDCGDSTQEWESEYSLPRINPVSVEGAEDVYGAEGINPCSDYSGWGRVSNNPSVGGIPVQDLEGWPVDPVYYQTNASLGRITEEYYDSYNDFMPEYRFPAPWSPQYSPRDPSRGPDFTVYHQTDGGRI